MWQSVQQVMIADLITQDYVRIGLAVTGSARPASLAMVNRQNYENLYYDHKQAGV